MVNVNYGRLQGDANLIEIGGVTIMIDGGYFNEANHALVPYLKKRGINHIDHFFVSHPHKDHYLGALALIRNGISIDRFYIRIPPKKICDREIPWGCDMANIKAVIAEVRKSGAKIISPKSGFSLKLPYASQIDILHAQEDDPPGKKIDVNDLSLIMKWKIFGKTVLFPGDLNKTIGEALSTDPRMNADILKMPHHGGRGLAPDSFFDAVAPNDVLVPGPKWIWCGERGSRPRLWVKTHHVPTWINGLHGNIVVTFTPSSTDIVAENPAAQCGPTPQAR